MLSNIAHRRRKGIAQQFIDVSVKFGSGFCSPLGFLVQKSTAECKQEGGEVTQQIGFSQHDDQEQGRQGGSDIPGKSIGAAQGPSELVIEDRQKPKQAEEAKLNGFQKVHVVRVHGIGFVWRIYLIHLVVFTRKIARPNAEQRVVLEDSPGVDCKGHSLAQSCAQYPEAGLG